MGGRIVYVGRVVCRAVTSTVQYFNHEGYVCIVMMMILVVCKVGTDEWM